MKIIENDMGVHLDVWDFVDVLNENNHPVCYGGREYGYGYDLKGNEPDKFNEMFKEWVKENRSNWCYTQYFDIESIGCDWV